MCLRTLGWGTHIRALWLGWDGGGDGIGIVHLCFCLMLENVDKYRVESDKFVLTTHNPADKSLFDGDKKAGAKLFKPLNQRLEALQELLYAEGKHKILIVLQAMDAGGKDGTIRHVFDGLNPQGVKVQSFKKPTEDELAHDYLWRVHEHTPASGHISIFNRSHYEDVLVVRVKGFVPEAQWQRRYGHIRDFERLLAEEGTTIIKLFLNVSKEAQRERFQARLDDPEKHWKFRVSDLEDRELWDEFQQAYETAITETAAPHAPWYVIPADRKWYRNLVITQILINHLEGLAMSFPEAEDGLDQIVIAG